MTNYYKLICILRIIYYKLICIAEPLALSVSRSGDSCLTTARSAPSGSSSAQWFRRNKAENGPNFGRSEQRRPSEPGEEIQDSSALRESNREPGRKCSANTTNTKQPRTSPRAALNTHCLRAGDTYTAGMKRNYRPKAA